MEFIIRLAIILSEFPICPLARVKLLDSVLITVKSSHYSSVQLCLVIFSFFVRTISIQHLACFLSLRNGVMSFAAERILIILSFCWSLLQWFYVTNMFHCPVYIWGARGQHCYLGQVIIVMATTTTTPALFATTYGGFYT